MATKVNQLLDLDTDRVDGVDKPATGRTFALFKSEEGAAGQEAILKGYALVATAAAEVLKAIRKDEHAQVSRSTAIALNGLAQILSDEPVFVGKAVPTQPYEYTEPDKDKRGPADENLGGNFTPRAMPGSMVGKVEFRLKDAAKQAEKKGPGPKMYDEEDEKMSKAGDKMPMNGGKPAFLQDEKEDEKKAGKKYSKDENGLEAVLTKLADGQTQLTEAFKSLVGRSDRLEKIAKGEDPDEKHVEAETVKPQSKQPQGSDVQKSAGHGSTPRFVTSFGDVVFGKQGR